MRFPKLSWRAIAWGFVANVVAMETIRYGTWYAFKIWIVGSGHTAGHSVTTILHGMTMVMNVIGAVLLVMAGLLTGYLGRENRYANAGVVGAAKIGYNCLTYATIHASTEQLLIALSAPVPFVLLGAFFAGFLPAKEIPLPPPQYGGEPPVKLL